MSNARHMGLCLKSEKTPRSRACASGVLRVDVSRARPLPWDFSTGYSQGVRPPVVFECAAGPPPRDFSTGCSQVHDLLSSSSVLLAHPCGISRPDVPRCTTSCRLRVCCWPSGRLRLCRWRAAQQIARVTEPRLFGTPFHSPRAHASRLVCDYSGSESSPPRSFVRFSNFVNSLRKTRFTRPVGPLRCLARSNSAIPRRSSRSGL